MDFKQTLLHYKSMINRDLSQFLDQEINATKNKTLKQNLELLEQYIVCGGKRIRPIVLLMAYKAFSGNEKTIIRPALSIELFHTSTLIFDDIMDEDDFRRGKEGIQKKLKDLYLAKNKNFKYDGAIFSHTSKRHSASRTMLIGVICDMLSRKVIAESELSVDIKLKTLGVLNKLVKEACEGQSLDLQMELDRDITEETYFEMISMKTASFFVAAVEIGSILACAPESDIIKFKQYAEKIALAFQIQDDIIDIIGKKGHDLGSDIKKGKRTLLVIKAFDKANSQQKRVLIDVLGKGDATKSEIGQAIDIFTGLGVIGYCRNIAAQNIEEGITIIKSMKLKNEPFFIELADLMLKREK